MGDTRDAARNGSTGTAYFFRHGAVLAAHDLSIDERLRLAAPDERADRVLFLVQLAKESCVFDIPEANPRVAPFAAVRRHETFSVWGECNSPDDPGISVG